MKCPYCANKESQVFRTEQYDEHNRRGRKCKKCGREFFTAEEVIEIVQPVRKEPRKL